MEKDALYIEAITWVDVDIFSNGPLGKHKLKFEHLLIQGYQQPHLPESNELTL